jgi:hypothetical protein
MAVELCGRSRGSGRRGGKVKVGKGWQPVQKPLISQVPT